MDAFSSGVVVVAFFIAGVGAGVFITGALVGVLLADQYPELVRRLLKK